MGHQINHIGTYDLCGAETVRRGNGLRRDGLGEWSYTQLYNMVPTRFDYNDLTY